MATMIKAKRRDKKKHTKKNVSQKVNETEISEEEEKKAIFICDEIQSDSIRATTQKKTVSIINDIVEKTQSPSTSDNVSEDRQVFLQTGAVNRSNLNTTVIESEENIVVVNTEIKLSEEVVTLGSCTQQSNLGCAGEIKIIDEDLLPSAPILEEREVTNYIMQKRENIKKEVTPTLNCISLEDAVRLFGGKEIDEIRAMSEREEAIVKAGPQSNPDHPLVDLLSTFRTSLMSVERERSRITCGYIEEGKLRANLWVVEKRILNITKKCACGVNVHLKATFDVARLQKDKLPAARLKLKSLLRDVQESYCHHQHAALQAHYDVDELLREILQNGKRSIREALMLILQELQLSDGAPEVCIQALQRWASILTASLLDERDPGQLLFLLHCLFRQTRSVRWAARAVRLHAADAPSAARLLAVLELLLARPPLEIAHECTEDSEPWEELDDGGEGGAVGQGRLRERDLVALLDALPLRELVARLALFARHDVTQEDERTWGDAAGGRGVLRASCGVRALLAVLCAGLRAHCSYARLRTHLRRVAGAALDALAALHDRCRFSYDPELRARVAAELEACFAAGFDVLGERAHAVPVALLSDASAAGYCAELLAGLHERSPLRPPWSREPVARPPCGAALHAAAGLVLRAGVGPLADRLLDRLLKTAMNREPVACEGSCGEAARSLLPRLLLALRDLHAAAFRAVADAHRERAVDPSALAPLARESWRPSPAEARVVLTDCAERAPALLQHLLLHLDYSPHAGVSLESQLAIGAWLCAWVRGRGEAPEWAWLALRTLRVHRTQWELPPDAPSHEEPEDLFSAAFALLASDWGHCVPLVCGPGVAALLRLARARPADAAPCAALLLRTMAQSPESVALTPTFGEVFAALLGAGPSLVGRALGLRGHGAAAALRCALLQHLRDTTAGAARGALLRAWLHALWSLALPAAARRLLDEAARVAREWRALDAHAALLLQGENANEYIVDAIRHVSVAPLLCESIVRNAHALELQSHTYGRLLDALAEQRAASIKIHVDNALKSIGCSLVADELAIHRCASAALQVSPQHPAHLLLWRLLLHMFLQRPPTTTPESTPPVGPLFFSGIVKSRTLSSLKKRLQETAAHHRARAESLRAADAAASVPAPHAPERVETPSVPIENGLFVNLTLSDLVGVPESVPRPSAANEHATVAEETHESSDRRDARDLSSFHMAAEKLLREYGTWLEEGERVRASPHCADVARFLPEQALNTAWRLSLDETMEVGVDAPRPAPPSPPALPATRSPYERAVAAILSIDRPSVSRHETPPLPDARDDGRFGDVHSFLQMLQRNLKELEKLTERWVSDGRRVSELDAQLWELVGKLRASRPLPPLRRACGCGCDPVEVYVAEHEWCVSGGAERAVRDNRRSARDAVRRLCAPRARDVRCAAALRSAARRVSSRETAARAADAAAAAAASTRAYPPARAAVRELLADLAARYLSADVRLAGERLARWSAGDAAQRELCPPLVCPARLPARDRPRLYALVAGLPLPPHVAFSYLSKFDVPASAASLDSAGRAALLRTAVSAAERLGAEPDESQTVLLELLRSQAVAAARGAGCELARLCARACVAGSLAPAFLDVLLSLFDARDAAFDFDELGHFLRELGSIWWEARTSPSAAGAPLYPAYAPRVGDTLRAALGAFVAAAARRTYGPERVATYAWSALHESWSPWVAPHAAAPLLPRSARADDMVVRFVGAVEMVMQNCPGGEDVLLRNVFEWTAGLCLGVEPHWPAECRAQAAALRARVTALPWHRQWFHIHSLRLVSQISVCGDAELAAWCIACVRHQAARAWTRGVPDERAAPALAALLDVFLSRRLSLPDETLVEARRLPWARLPVAAADGALERFFSEHYAPALPSCRAPQFAVLLTACQLTEPASDARVPGDAATKRAIAVSWWARAAAEPALLAHAAEHARRMLDTLANLAPVLEANPGELEHLLGRAAVLLCVEPAATNALLVWREWVATCALRVRRACASAATAVTAPAPFAALAEQVARALLGHADGAGWSELCSRWAACPHADCGALLARGSLHAAYAMLLVAPADDAGLRRALDALRAADIDFVNDETIVAVWICAAGRLAPPARGGCTEEARALLASWAERRRTLLQVVALQSAAACPTAHHRVLCRLALLVAAPSEDTWRAYEACGGPQPDSAPRPSHLPRLAAQLYPHAQVYFERELALAEESP